MKTFILHGSFYFSAENLDDAFSKLSQHFLNLRDGEDSHLIEAGGCQVYAEEDRYEPGRWECPKCGREGCCPKGMAPSICPKCDEPYAKVDPNACNPFNAQVRLIEATKGAVCPHGNRPGDCKYCED